MKRRLPHYLPTAITAAIIGNLVVIYFISIQFIEASSLHKEWKQIKETQIDIAIQLAEVERAFGYVGFIHHFKNYIIRHNDEYYAKAKISYEKVSSALEALKIHPLPYDDRQYIDIIEQTLKKYADNLEIGRQYHGQYPIRDLDRRVKVDDAAAEAALNNLRKAILPRLKIEKEAINEHVIAFRRDTIIAGLAIIPLFLFATLFILRTLRKQHAQLNELSAVFDASPDAIIYVDVLGNIIKTNQRAEKIFGYTQRELLQLKIEDLVDPKIRHEHVHLREKFMEKQQMRYMANRQSKVMGMKKDGSLVSLSIAIAAQELDDAMVGICIVKDMTEELVLQEKSESDHLTSLSNRRHFDYILERELERSKRTNKDAALLLIDVDHFKNLNDTHGHLEGDKALKAIASFLIVQARASDYIARWGGDEFAIFCPELTPTQAVTFAERLRQSFAEYTIHPDCPLTFSIGVTGMHIPEPINPETMLEAADKAVYAAKELGRNKVIHYSDL